MNVSKKGMRIELTWNKEDHTDVAKAKEFFMKLTRQGWLVARRDGELRRILKFVPEYEELLFMPPIEGG